MTEPTPPHLLIAGGSGAALETLLALRDLAGDRVSVTLVAPQASFTYRPMTVAQPSHLGHAREYALADFAEEFQAVFIHDGIAEVRAEENPARTTQAPAPASRSDRLDARMLAKLLMSGLPCGAAALDDVATPRTGGAAWTSCARSWRSASVSSTPRARRLDDCHERRPRTSSA